MNPLLFFALLATVVLTIGIRSVSIVVPEIWHECINLMTKSQPKTTSNKTTSDKTTSNNTTSNKTTGDKTTGYKTKSKKTTSQKPAAKPRTLADVVKLYGATARKRIKPFFVAAGIAYPPDKITLVGLKEEKVLIVIAPDDDGNLKRVVSYPILAASGEAGPKLKQGDCQVPEGFYKIELFNPNSRYHLSLRVNYPNAEDAAHARADKRTNLGGDIMIHGNEVSVGCLAIGDEGIEDIFILAHDTGKENIDVVLAPSDLTCKSSGVDFKLQPAWLKPLYKRLKARLSELPPLSD